MERFNTLDDIRRQAWNLLFRATVERNSPLRTPVLATTDQQGMPHVRTVVLRKADTEKQALYYFTDIRSDKIRELNIQSQASALFWDPKRNIQLRCTGPVTVHHKDDLATAFWQNIAKPGRKAYATQQPPGTTLTEYSTGLPDNWPELDLSDTDGYLDHFAVLVHQIDHLDILHLEREGHQRARFSREGNDWNGTWVVP